ncbi:MAG: Na+/H+ antiporter NhaC family protein [Lentisphaeria bacterium]|nr:Na+/H+ antiporter NhaC family protein [Lentisphaeria bacterium]
MQTAQQMKCREPRFRALIPFFVFVVFYLGLSIWAHDFYKVPMPTAFLVASAAALMLDHKRPLGEKVEIYARGMGEPNIMIMCLIFILAGAFASTAKGMGAVDGAVVIARAVVPDSLMLLGMFLVSSFISLAVGTSCGTIAALTPIAAGLAGGLSISPAMLLGAIVGGAMFGDNLSMISDTTIAATRTQNIPMRDKFRQNILIVLPAVAATSAIYLFCGGTATAAGTVETQSVTWAHAFAVLPYLLILVFALFGWNVMLLLFAGTVLAGITGIINGAFDFWGMLDLIGQGTLGMSETLIVAILAGGLLQTIRRNGGIGYLMEKIRKPVRSARGCEFGVLILVSVINLFTANNTVAIVIAGPIARELSEQYHCSAKRIASILDTGSCVVQGMIPYGAQILIAAGVAQTSKLDVSSLSLVGSLFYPMILGVCLIAAIALHREKQPAPAHD